ncbi:MAG TPA: integrin alpha, partial [Solirubrobacteraceae bacterium]|nr:integrin alpha [Solirubrobacteraceae bacterium]
VNPYAQADVDNPSTRIVNQLELFGHSVAPIGDIGTCNSAPNAAGFCPSAQLNANADGRPDVLVSAFRVDYPTSGPDNEENYDVGVAVALDGATGAVLQTYRHPDPDTGSIFGFTITNQPAVGNAGGTATPDIYLPAAGQDTDENRGEGIGFMLNGAFLVTGNNVDLQRFRSAKPYSGLGYGTSAAGVGNVFGDNVFNEILIGAFPGRGVSHVAFHDPISGAALQTIDDPDAQELSAFGVGVAPMGDINGDGFLDVAVGAGRFDRAGIADTGRIYIMRSDNSPPPVTPAPAPPAPPAPVTEVGALAGRSLELVASRARVRRGSSVRLDGTLEAFANPAGCQNGQEVEIQRRAVDSPRYATVARARTDANGDFRATTQAGQTSFFRARIGQSAGCAGAVSAREQVDVTPSIRVLTRTARLTGARQIRLQVDCRTDDGPCNGTVKLRTARPIAGRNRTLPTASFQAPGNRRRSVTVTVGTSTAALLRRSRSVSMRAFVVGRDARGNSTTVVARLTVRTR